MSSQQFYWYKKNEKFTSSGTDRAASVQEATDLDLVRWASTARAAAVPVRQWTATNRQRTIKWRTIKKRKTEENKRKMLFESVEDKGRYQIVVFLWSHFFLLFKYRLHPRSQFRPLFSIDDIFRGITENTCFYLIRFTIFENDHRKKYYSRACFSISEIICEDKMMKKMGRQPAKKNNNRNKKKKLSRLENRRSILQKDPPPPFHYLTWI